MVRLSSRGHSARAFAVLTLLAAAGCSDTVVSPTADLRGTVAPSDGLLQGSSLHRGRYRDSSRPNATGRSGSATLSARAVLDSLGVTHLLVTSGSIREAGIRGELAKVQIKAWGPDGEPLFTQNHQRPTSGGQHEFLLQGVPAGSRIQVQANVRGVDRNRTDVVTVTETVKLDAQVSTTIIPPPDPRPDVPTVITSTIRETNGDVGTTVACVLYVNGVEVDRGDDVWVDAGDEVSCAFTYTFDPGDYNVEVVLVDGDGGRLASDDIDIEVEDFNPTPSWSATVMDRTVTTLARYDLNWWNPNGSHKEYEQTVGESPRSQTVAITATLARATTFPLAGVSLALSSNAMGTFQTASWAGLVGVPVGGQTCADQLIPDNGGHFTLCSTGTGFSGSTTFGYTRFAGTVTYHSRGFSSTWDGIAGTLTYWTWNDNPTYFAAGGQMRDLGTSVGIQLGISDLVGSYSVSATVGITQFDNMLSEIPYACREESPWWLDGGVQTICEGRTEREFGWSGEASG